MFQIRVFSIGPNLLSEKFLAKLTTVRISSLQGDLPLLLSSSLVHLNNSGVTEVIAGPLRPGCGSLAVYLWSCRPEQGSA